MTDEKGFKRSADRLAADLDPSGLTTAKCYTVKQSEMTADCFFVQVRGLAACESCEQLGRKECGGVAVREKIKAGGYPPDGIGKLIE